MTSSGIATTTVGDIELAYETFGDPGDPPLLLVMGLGDADDRLAPTSFCADLAARGLLVIRFDNRDIGLSTHLRRRRSPPPSATSAAGTGRASLRAGRHGRRRRRAARRPRARARARGRRVDGRDDRPERSPSTTRSGCAASTSIMSTTGDRSVGSRGGGALGAVLAAPPAADREALSQRAVDSLPGDRLPRLPVRRGGDPRAGRPALRPRRTTPPGVARQLAAIVTSPRPHRDLGAGRACPPWSSTARTTRWCNVVGGRATAAAIPGARAGRRSRAWATTCPARCGRS